MMQSLGPVQDLGNFGDSPVLVCGGAYSNLQALEALLSRAKTLGFPPERTLHTGDVVAYCGNPLECSRLLKSSGVVCLMGNCEESVGQGKQDCGCGFPADSACNEFAANWYAYTMQQLKDAPDLQEWMGAMPQRIELVLAGRRLAVIHGGTSQINKFLFPSEPDEKFLEEFDILPHVDGILCGHSGFPFTRLLKPREGSPHAKRGVSSLMWHNSGALGMPANDGTPRVWFSVLTPGHSGLDVVIHPLDYDHEAAVRAVMDSNFLNRGYGDALHSGIWPSLDILPVEEHMATGHPLDAHKLRTVWPNESRRSVSQCLSIVWGIPALVVVTGIAVILIRGHK